jgi:hypothetical protein
MEDEMDTEGKETALLVIIEENTPMRVGTVSPVYPTETQ